MNNPIWMMTSAFPDLKLEEIVDKACETNIQGLDICVFRRDGSRQDHVATHIDYEAFDPAGAQKFLDYFESKRMRFSIGAYENLIGGEPEQRIPNQNHLLYLIRMAHLLGGDENSIRVGTFVGYNHELGVTEGGFEKNLREYERVFKPIIQYAEDLGVTVIYENCPMEGWRSSGFTNTYNNLPGTLAARKLMYTLIPNPAHGEIYDPSHDVWQHTDPSEVIRNSDPERIKMVHVKATRLKKNSAAVHWGGMYPIQDLDPELAVKAGVPIPAHDWDRQNYEAMVPGFGGSDSMDWREFVEALDCIDFNGPFSIENEADLSKGTGNLNATLQGFSGAVHSLMPMIWPLTRDGYCFDYSKQERFKSALTKAIPVTTMSELI
jgi:sugar phosphate isomerase/epimerase